MQCLSGYRTNSQPLLYVRDSNPGPQSNCYTHMHRLHKLKHGRHVSEAERQILRQLILRDITAGQCRKLRKYQAE